MSTRTTKRPSRASRAADQAKTEANGQAETRPEVCKHDMDPAGCAECNGTAKAQANQKADTTTKAEPTPAPELPLAACDLGAYKITYHKPQIVLPDGTVVKLEARWGFEDPKKAAAWVRKTAAEHGVRVEL